MEAPVRRVLALVVLAAIGFWGVWPAYSGWRIHGALKDGNADVLATKIDFDSVRASLRPSVGAEVEKRVTEALAKAGPGGALLGADIKSQVVPKLVESALATLVTPQNLIRIYREGGAAKDAIGRIMAEQMGKSGGLGGLPGGTGANGSAGALGEIVKGLGGIAGGASGAGGTLGGLGGLLGGGKSPVTDVTSGSDKPAAGADAKTAAPPSYGLGNIKSFGFNGPLGMSVGVAKDPAAKEADVTADISFTGLDWKLTGLKPRF